MNKRQRKKRHLEWPQTEITAGELLEFLRGRHIHGTQVHRYLEIVTPEGTSGGICDLQMILDEWPNRVLETLQEIHRLPVQEKRVLKAIITDRFRVTNRGAFRARATLFAAVDAIPETPTFSEAPLFSLPGWQ